jgi:diphthamide synthase (EF-2-diphthine--ammonia ligase)
LKLLREVAPTYQSVNDLKSEEEDAVHFGTIFSSLQEVRAMNVCNLH